MCCDVVSFGVSLLMRCVRVKQDCKMKTFILAVEAVALGVAMNVLYIPLDERFTTRDAFLNLAAVTPYNVSTPDTSIISLQRQPANLPAMDAWINANMPAADASIMSLELFLYGGLINSRCSNDTTASIIQRVDQLIGYATQYPQQSMLLGTVVMRIPAYNTDPPTEDPWYWQYYGLDLFTYSFYLSKYNHTHNASDLATAEAAAAQVPASILNEFVWRRHRNFNVTSYLLQRYAQSVAAGRPLFHSLYITLDDNAEYGFNIDESVAFKQMVQTLGLSNYVKIYPGADEVGLTMLARLAADSVQSADAYAASGNTIDPVLLVQAGDRVGTQPTLQLVFRKADNASLNLIPNYEGQPMIQTLMDHVTASGAVGSMSADEIDALLSGPTTRPWRDVSRSAPWPIHSGKGQQVQSSIDRPTAVLLMDNFGTDEFPQIEAPNQPPPGPPGSGRNPADYGMFTPYFCGSAAAQTNVVSFASNRYSNGADSVLVTYMVQKASDATCTAPAPTSNGRGLGLDRAAFSGWNTDGNSVGTAVANLVLLHYFADFGPYATGARETISRLAAWTAARRASRPSHVASGSTTLTTVQRQLQSVPCTGSCANGYFNILRIVEDNYWQASLRQTLSGYISLVDGETTGTLALDLDFYQRYSLKVLSSRSRDLSAAFGGLPWNITSMYYPWNRTFEIGLIASGGQ